MPESRLLYGASTPFSILGSTHGSSYPICHSRRGVPLIVSRRVVRQPACTRGGILQGGRGGPPGRCDSPVVASEASAPGPNEVGLHGSDPGTGEADGRGGGGRRPDDDPAVRGGTCQPIVRRTHWREEPGKAGGSPVPPRFRRLRRRQAATWVPIMEQDPRDGPPSCSFQTRFRACRTTHALSGCRVQPARCARRLPTSMKNRTCRRTSHTVSTVKKSTANS